MKELIPAEAIENNIYLIRGQKVLLDWDLALLYQVPTRRLKEQVKRNIERFPVDFMFQLTWSELDRLLKSRMNSCSRTQFATLKRGENIKYLPYAFTEQGVSMLSSVLRSKRAIRVNIAIMRAFVQIRHFLTTHKALAHKLKELEGRVGKHDEQITAIFEAIRQLMEPPESPKKRIGFEV